ncbi:MAG: hypothetical protein AVO35_13230 [Candidatus Aegiribacteria sp. MLS_C]|nr:MAG: hypothetical protein AVO35_13230 [Candidatus Aegiribacteria sp. MLS_C]
MKTCGDFGGTTRAGRSCRNPAGFKTDHQGEGKCHLHGGAARGRPIKHGRYAKKTSRQLRDKIEAHLENPRPLDLSEELALLRALADYLLESLGETGDMGPDLGPILSAVDRIRQTVDTVSKIQAREALTAQETVLVAATLADILKKNIEDEDTLRHVLGELRVRLCPSLTV